MFSNTLTQQLAAKLHQSQKTRLQVAHFDRYTKAVRKVFDTISDNAAKTGDMFDADYGPQGRLQFRFVD